MRTVPKGRALPAVPRPPRPAGALERLRRHRYGRLVEPLADEASFLVKPMFGCLACYLHGRLMLVLADRRPPWQGLLVPTAHESHATLLRDVPGLGRHPVLRKWLHLAESAADFDAAAERLVAMARGDDPRLGVESAPRPPRSGRDRGRLP